MSFVRSNAFNRPTMLRLRVLLIILLCQRALCIRIPSDRISENPRYPPSNHPLKTAIFALGSFWRSEAVFGCLNGVVRTTVGYSGGSKTNPEYRSLGDHAECVQVSSLSLYIYVYVYEFSLKGFSP